MPGRLPPTFRRLRGRLESGHQGRPGVPRQLHGRRSARARRILEGESLDEEREEGPPLGRGPAVEGVTGDPKVSTLQPEGGREDVERLELHVATGDHGATLCPEHITQRPIHMLLDP